MDLGRRCIQPGNVKSAILRKSQETEYDLSDVSRRDAGQDFEGIMVVVGVPGAIGRVEHAGWSSRQVPLDAGGTGDGVDFNAEIGADFEDGLRHDRDGVMRQWRRGMVVRI